jgi:hypothetical protein
MMFISFVVMVSAVKLVDLVVVDDFSTAATRAINLSQSAFMTVIAPAGGFASVDLRYWTTAKAALPPVSDEEMINATMPVKPPSSRRGDAVLISCAPRSRSLTPWGPPSQG